MSNYSNTQTIALDALATIAIGEARGSTSMTTFALAAMDQVAEGTWTLPRDAKTLYLARFTPLNAEQLALNKKVTKAPEGKSLEGQVSKFLGILSIGQRAVDTARPELLTVARNAAYDVGHNYKRTLAGNVAIRKLLDDDATTEAPALLQAAKDAAKAAEAKPDDARAAWDKLAEGFDAFVKEFPSIVRAVGGDAGTLPGSIAELSARMSKVSKHIAVAVATEALLEG